MTQRIIIRHISGTRLHQTDEFQTDGMRAITAGRSDSANIQLDSQREDMVSREHLRITPQTPGSDIFLLTDLNSRNGTFLNRLRISQSSSIRHNDVVQLGPDGPEFRFELDPPPMSAVKPTRFVDGAQQAALSRMTPTREVALGGPQARPIGRATVERMLGDTFGKVKKESNKTLWIGIAALVLIIVVGATTLMALRSSSDASSLKAQQQQQLLFQLAQTVQQPRPADPAIKSRIDQMSADLSKMIAENRQMAGGAAKGAPGKGQAALGAPVQSNPAADGNAPDTYEAAFAKASDEYRGGNATAAYTDSVALISADGSRYEAYFLAGLCLTSMQRPADAVPVYQYALQTAPEAARSGIAQKLAEAQNAAQQQPGQAQ